VSDSTFKRLLELETRLLEFKSPTDIAEIAAELIFIGKQLAAQRDAATKYADEMFSDAMLHQAEIYYQTMVSEGMNEHIERAMELINDLDNPEEPSGEED
jgi:hypothetical protein